MKNNQVVIKLLPCPFCGGKVVEDVIQWNIAQAKCTECYESWGTCGTKYEGRFEKWNARANEKCDYCDKREATNLLCDHCIERERNEGA